MQINISNYANKYFFKFRNRWLDKYYFIHINKTGGSSLEKALKLPHEHKSVREKINQLGTINWTHRYTFTIVRNPWDKVVSHYHYRVMTNQTNLGNDTISFSDWIHKVYIDKDLNYYDKPKMFQTQTEWLINNNNEIDIDFIGRFENLQADFNKVSQHLKIDTSLPHHKKSKRKPNYQFYYNDTTRKIIEEFYAKDIENFKYSFK